MNGRRTRYGAWPGSELELWDDLRFPAGNLTTPASSAPDYETDTGFPLFDAGSTEFLYGIAQMPHGWKEESTVRPHVHWTPTTTGSGNVLWELRYQVRNPENDAAFDFSSGWSTLTVVSPASTVAHKAQVDSFGNLAMTGYTLSALIAFRLARLGGNAADTYAADARLLEFDIHFQSDSAGSIRLFTKV